MSPLHASMEALAIEMDARVDGNVFEIDGYKYEVIGIIVAEKKDDKRTGELAARMDGSWT